MINLILNEESKWWNIEKNSIESFVWSSGKSQLEILKSNVIKYELLVSFTPAISNKICIILGESIQEVYLKEGENLISLENPNNSNRIAIVSESFVPHALNSKHTDFRNLGIILKKIRLILENDVIECFPSDFLYKNESEAYDTLIKNLNDNGKLMDYRLFNHTKYTPKKKPTVFLYLHLPFKTIFQSLNNYKMSKNFDIIYFSCNSEVCEKFENVIKIPNFEIATSDLMYKKTYEAAKAFEWGTKIALEKNIDYMFWLEWDCLFGKDYWLDTLWEEHNSWNSEPIISGTPIATPSIHNVYEGYNLQFMMQNYVSEYVINSKVAMGNIPHNRNSLFFINGGLSFYNIPEITKHMSQYSMYSARRGFDVYLGEKMFEVYREKVFDKCAWLKSSYSGGNPYKIYTDEQILKMLNSGLKVAVHPYKVF